MATREFIKTCLKIQKVKSVSILIFAFFMLGLYYYAR